MQYSSYLGPKISIDLVRYTREFVITVLLITEFDCINISDDVTISASILEFQTKLFYDMEMMKLLCSRLFHHFSLGQRKKSMEIKKINFRQARNAFDVVQNMINQNFPTSDVIVVRTYCKSYPTSDVIIRRTYCKSHILIPQTTTS